MTIDSAAGRPAPSRPVRAAEGPPSRTRWWALLVMTATSFVLVTAEFLPSGLLTPMAADLGITPGQAAQTITVTAVVGFLVAPTIALMVPRQDRRRLLALLTLAAAVSNLVVALTPQFWLILTARLLLGAALSGFWAMMLAIAVRLSRPEQVGRAVMVVTLGVSIATVAGVPLGVLLASALGWRSAFVAVAIASVVVSLLLTFVLPAIPPAPAAGLRVLGETLRRREVPSGLAGHLLTVLGHFTAYAFIRLAIEQAEGIGVGTVGVLLALFGIGGFVGNLVIGLLVDRHLRALAYGVPLVTAIGIAGVALGVVSLPLLAAAVVLWGAAFGGWLIVVNGWVSRRLPDRLEAGGGLVVAGFQLAITLGAALGGSIVDSSGVRTALLVGAAVLVVGAAVFGAANRSPERVGSAPADDVPTGATAIAPGSGGDADPIADPRGGIDTDMTAERPAEACVR